jgi:hypothetical protein
VIIEVGTCYLIPNARPMIVESGFPMILHFATYPKFYFDSILINEGKYLFQAINFL